MGPVNRDRLLRLCEHTLFIMCFLSELFPVQLPRSFNS